MSLRRFHLDYETKSELDLKKAGLDRYSADESTEILMCSYGWSTGDVKIWDATEEPEPPEELIDAVLDDQVEKWAFNAAFERVHTWRKLFPILRRMGYQPKQRYRSWKCAMVLAYMQSFIGGLDQIGALVGLPEHMQKDANGTKLMKMFSMPQRTTKNQPLRWLNSKTNPWEWADYKDYCVTDTVAEREVVFRLLPFEILDGEWWNYWLDQIINDRGLPIDRKFCEGGLYVADRRKRELIDGPTTDGSPSMKQLTGLANPNSVQQLLPWLQERGYPFEDLRKDTVKKVLVENAEAPNEQVWSNEWGQFLPGESFMTDEACAALGMRQQTSRTSPRKFQAVLDRLAPDDMCRHVFQFAGASRTNRAAGRAMQPHNLTRTPSWLEDEPWLEEVGVSRLEDVTHLIREQEYEMLALYAKEPMDAVAGTVRSMIHAPDGMELVVCDLASIESVVIGGISNCQRLLNVFREGRDAYKDFATELYEKAYEDVTKKERTNSKPATLGAGYRLGGGELHEGKKTGLWGYAESMGIQLTKEESHKAVAKFREVYHEIPQTWYAYENAIADTVRSGRVNKVGLLEFSLKKPYLRVKLPSGRYMYYHKPQVHLETRISPRTGNEYQKEVVSYMGKKQNSQAWVRIYSHGGKWIENFVQAIARDILYLGMRRAHEFGFNIVGHVHDEIIALQRKGDNQFTWEALRGLMAQAIDWFPDLPLGAAGYSGPLYKKD